MEAMNNLEEPFDFRVGDRVALIADDWTMVGHDIVLVDAEPVPGSTQCLVEDGGEVRVVSRSDLRHI